MILGSKYGKPQWLLCTVVWVLAKDRQEEYESISKPVYITISTVLILWRWLQEYLIGAADLLEAHVFESWTINLALLSGRHGALRSACLIVPQELLCYLQLTVYASLASFTCSAALNTNTGITHCIKCIALFLVNALISSCLSLHKLLEYERFISSLERIMVFLSHWKAAAAITYKLSIKTLGSS